LGWDYSTVNDLAPIEYHLGQLAAGSAFTATLTWNRQVGWTDADANGFIDSLDSFALLSPLDNLTLKLQLNGVTIAESMSSVDNVEHIYLTNLAGGDYSLVVTDSSGSGTTDPFGLAWSGVAAVPEPGSMALLGSGIALLLSHRSRSQRRERRV
jgi:hypothetical protein